MVHPIEADVSIAGTSYWRFKDGHDVEIEMVHGHMDYVLRFFLAMQHHIYGERVYFGSETF